MTTVALQISDSGLSWAVMPDPISTDGENEVIGHRVRWPWLPWYSGGALPHAMDERVRAYGVVRELVEDAEVVLFAVESCVDGRRVGIAEVALEAVGCQVVEVWPHPDGAAGIMREHVKVVVRETRRPPGI